MTKTSGKKPPRGAVVEEGKKGEFIFNVFEGAGQAFEPEPVVQMPSIDVYSTAAELVVEVELPGVRKEDIEVLLHRNTLTIKAAKTEFAEQGKINYVCMERSFGRIFRAIDLPFPVDTVNMKAVYKGGVLTISIPLVEDKRSAVRRVPVEYI